MGQSIVDRFVVLGRIGAPFGIRGWVHIQSFTETPNALLSYDPWYIPPAPLRRGVANGDFQPYKVAEAKEQGTDLVVRLDGCTDRETAKLFTNREIAVPREALPKLPEGEVYWDDLYNLKVITDSGLLLGKIVDVLETGANDVLVVEGDKRHLIPYVSDYVLSVDLYEKVVKVHWDPEF